MAAPILLLTWHCNEEVGDYCIVAWYLEGTVVHMHADSNVGRASSHGAH